MKGNYEQVYRRSDLLATTSTESLRRDSLQCLSEKHKTVADSILAQATKENTTGKYLPPLTLSDHFVDRAVKGGNEIHPEGKPRVGMAWNGATNLDEPVVDSMARHDIVIGSAGTFGLKPDNKYPGLATDYTEASIDQADKLHQQIVEKNPSITTLEEIRYRDAKPDYLPADSPSWQRDNRGEVVRGYVGAGPGYQMLDIRQPELQDQVARQAAAAIKSGTTNGVMLDWFNDGVHKGKDWDEARLQMLEKIRRSIGDVNPKAQIFINTNAETVPDTVAKLVNGYYMECNQSTNKADWNKITRAVDNAEKQGKIPFVETWFDPNMSRAEENKMRATMALVMTHAPDGVALFGDPDGLRQKEHQHDFYQFYETKIGKPRGPDESISGTSQRDFDTGKFVYNPIGNGPQKIQFDQPRTSAVTGKRGTTFVVAAEDGDFFSK